MPTVSLANSVPKNATAVDLPVCSDALSKLPANLKRAAKQNGFEGKTGQTLIMVGTDGPTQVMVGVGPSKELAPDKLRRAAAAYARAVANHEQVACTLMSMAADMKPNDALAGIAEGLRLASYRFTELKSSTKLKKAVKLKKVTVIATGTGLKAQLTAINKVIDSVELARDMVNKPGGLMTPAAFVAQAKAAAAKSSIKVTVWNEARIKREKLGGVLAVNQGSEHPPQFLILEYKPSGKTKPKAKVALVGKGVTFDSGGLSLKTSQGMMIMKVDMAGAAAVLGTMLALPAVKAPVAVTAYIPLTDNMTGPDAQRPGDVFTARNGKTVEVLNTDAEGRLILADALSLAAESDADAIIDIATLTGSATAALGTGYSALMATNDRLAKRIEDAAERTSEKVWRLPLPLEYRPQLDSAVADVRNIGTAPYGGALVAGLFLKEFVGKKPWAHLDVGLSVYSDSTKGANVKGATGYGVRLLLAVLSDWK